MMSITSSYTECLKKIPRLPFTEIVRYASKKTGTSTKNHHTKVRPKFRGMKYQEGTTVTAGTMLATQTTARWMPGLNVGFGRNTTLYAMEAGKVFVTCEKVDPNWDHQWIKRVFGGRPEATYYKKYFNVIPEPQHTRFKLIDEI